LGLVLRAKKHLILESVLPVIDELVSAGFRISAQTIADVKFLAGE
jgi:predicted nucleic acid-binding protein